MVILVALKEYRPLKQSIFKKAFLSHRRREKVPVEGPREVGRVRVL